MLRHLNLKRSAKLYITCSLIVLCSLLTVVAHTNNSHAYAATDPITAKCKAEITKLYGTATTNQQTLCTSAYHIYESQKTDADKVTKTDDFCNKQPLSDRNQCLVGRQLAEEAEAKATTGSTSGSGSSGSGSSGSSSGGSSGSGSGSGSSTSGSSGTSGSGTATDDTVDCESNGGLAWILCPVITGISNAVDKIYSVFIQPLLVTSPVDINNSDPNGDHTYAIWSNFRVYGDIFLVIALLVVVFGESIGGGLIDAYAAKKILPRLLIATVAINLSIYIIAFAVDATNILGNGLAGLIEQPFKSVAGGFHLQLGNGGAGIGIAALVASGGAIWSIGSAGAAGAVGGAAGAAGAAAAVGVMLEFFLVFVLIPMFFIFIAIMATLLIRKALILLLILSAPIAFALYCLPNTEKYFRKWFELLTQTLLIYPIIAVLFALSNIMSVTLSKATGFSGALSDLMSIVALVVPLIIIPFSFKVAGGLIGRVSELAHGYGKRGVEGVKGSAQDGDSWRNRTRRNAAMLNTEAGLSQKAISTRFKNPTGVLTTGGRQKRRQNQDAVREAMRIKLGGQFAESDTVQKANAKNDQYQLALADEDMAKDKLKAARAKGDTAGIAAWEQAIASARVTPKTAATRLVAANAVAQSGFHYEPGQEGYNQLAKTMSRITGADLQYDDDGNVSGATGTGAGAYANAMNNAQYGFRTAGRFDLGGINNGTGYDFDSGMSKASGYTAGQAKTDTFIAGAKTKLGVNTAGKNENEVKTVLTERLASGSLKAADAGAWHAKLLDAQMSATGANKDEITKQLNALEAATSAFGQPDAPPLTVPGTSNEVVTLSQTMRKNREALRQRPDPNTLDNES